MRAPEFKPGTESLDVQLFALGDIPWDDLAFPVVREAWNGTSKTSRAACSPSISAASFPR